MTVVDVRRIIQNCGGFSVLSLLLLQYFVGHLLDLLLPHHLVVVQDALVRPALANDDAQWDKILPFDSGRIMSNCASVIIIKTKMNFDTGKRPPCSSTRTSDELCGLTAKRMTRHMLKLGK